MVVRFSIPGALMDDLPHLPRDDSRHRPDLAPFPRLPPECSGAGGAADGCRDFTGPFPQSLLMSTFTVAPPASPCVRTIHMLGNTAGREGGVVPGELLAGRAFGQVNRQGLSRRGVGHQLAKDVEDAGRAVDDDVG